MALPSGMLFKLRVGARAYVDLYGLSAFRPDDLEVLNLSGRRISRAGFGQISRMVGLRVLDLSESDTSDMGLASLKDLPRLRVLNLASTFVSNEGLLFLVMLPAVEELSLANTQISDDGLIYLRKLSRLSKLNLAHTQLGDSSVSLLGNLYTLRELTVTGAKFSEIGLHSLQTSLHRCKIMWAQSEQSVQPDNHKTRTGDRASPMLRRRGLFRPPHPKRSG
jgi:hypothetical protein